VTPLKGSRVPATVMGALIREMYPNVLQNANGPRPVLTWDDFKKTTTRGVPDDQRVVSDFGVCFTQSMFLHVYICLICNLIYKTNCVLHACAVAFQMSC
jgi:hypothetical protein